MTFQSLCHYTHWGLFVLSCRLKLWGFLCQTNPVPTAFTKKSPKFLTTKAKSKPISCSIATSLMLDHYLSFWALEWARIYQRTIIFLDIDIEVCLQFWSMWYKKSNTIKIVYRALVRCCITGCFITLTFPKIKCPCKTSDYFLQYLSFSHAKLLWFLEQTLFQYKVDTYWFHNL